MPRVRVVRDDQGFRDRFRSYRVVLDGEIVGRVKRGETVTMHADPGRHELHLAIDWARSPSVEFDLIEDDECIIECWPNKKSLLTPVVGNGRFHYIGIHVRDADADRSLSR